MRSVSLTVVAIWLGLATTAFAQSSPDTQSAPPEDQAPVGPVLQPADYSPVVCDPSAAGFRYLEVRGNGFDAWATQHLVGDVFDANGARRIHWSNIWVSPQGQLIVEVNLCSDPITHRAALDAGDYTVAVDQNNGANIAATGISLVPPPQTDQSAETDQTEPPANPTAPTPTPVSPLTYVIPNVQPQPTPTPLPIASLAAPTSAPGPRTWPGSLQQPYPPGAPGTLVDGWQLVITGVTPDAFTGIQAAVPSAIKPASDQRDFMVRAQATYLGPGTGVFSGVRLALLSTVTQLTYDQIHNNCGVVPDSIVPSVVIQGTTVRGNVCFTVHASDIGSLIAFDNQPTASDRVYFALD